MFGAAAFRVARAPLTTSSIAARAFSSTPRASVARMSIVGRLAKAPEDLSQGKEAERSIVRFALGTDSGRGDKKKTSWFRVISFTQGAQRDFLTSLPKGALLYVDADARMDTYEDEEGVRRQSLGLVAKSFEVLSVPKQNQDTTESVGEGDEGLVQSSTG